jgi:hypothetical protein
MLVPVDIYYIADQLVELGDEIQRAFDESAFPSDPPPQVLLTALDRLLDTLRTADKDTPEESARALRDITGSEPENLLDHGLRLLSELAYTALQLNLPQHAYAIEQLSLPLCCWILRRGGELLHAELVINAAAKLTNSLNTPDQAAELYAIMNEIMDGIGLERALEWEITNPARPWRALLVSRALVATHSQQLRLMEDAFDAVVEHLPEEAPDVFREGMGLVESDSHPEQVRELMQRYFERWCSGQRLH